MLGSRYEDPKANACGRCTSRKAEIIDYCNWRGDLMFQHSSIQWQYYLKYAIELNIYRKTNALIQLTAVVEFICEPFAWYAWGAI